MKDKQETQNKSKAQNYLEKKNSKPTTCQGCNSLVYVLGDYTCIDLPGVFVGNNKITPIPDWRCPRR